VVGCDAMRRLACHLCTALAAGALILCGATLAFWGRSHAVGDYVLRYRPPRMIEVKLVDILKFQVTERRQVFLLNGKVTYRKRRLGRCCGVVEHCLGGSFHDLIRQSQTNGV